MTHIVKMHVHCQRSKLASVLNKKKVYPQLYRITKRTIHTPTFFVSSNAVNHSAEAFSKETKNAYNQKKVGGFVKSRDAVLIFSVGIEEEAR